VPNVEQHVNAKSRRRAAAHGCSMAAEVPAILRTAVVTDVDRQGKPGTRTAARFARIGLRSDEDIPALRVYAPNPATFDL